jgi:hypothetical protein
MAGRLLRMRYLLRKSVHRGLLEESMSCLPNLSPFSWDHSSRITRKPDPTRIQERSIRRPVVIPYDDRLLQRGLQRLMDCLVREGDVQEGFEFE